MNERKRLSFGIKTSQMNVSYGDILRAWREADTIPVIEHAWLWDHMVPLRGPSNGAALEGWTLLAALAAQTERVRIGVMVTSNRLRPPAVLAKMAATVDVISGGRLDFGIGAGGSRLPGAPAELMEIVRREFGAYGIPIVAAADAVRALGEACTLIRKMWTEDDPFDFDGRYYQLRGAVCEPKPVQRPHPPVLIGGAGEKMTLRVVAEQADLWNCPARTADELRHYSGVLDEHCAAIGRDPRQITRSVQILLRDADPAAARRVLLEFIEAGATHLVVAPVAPIPSLKWLAGEIIEPVAAAAAAGTASAVGTASAAGQG
jgi:alkanesulfonate monooxygenase SsuD/methylene tetrahydromethanopterin reductase-like flavin-dependent oxidoreductase (luciferase family)